MTRSLFPLLLSACATAIVAPSDATSPPSSLRGTVIYRPECFGLDVDEGIVGGGQGGQPGGWLSRVPSGRSYNQAPPAPPVASAPMAEAEEAAAPAKPAAERKQKAADLDSSWGPPMDDKAASTEKRDEPPPAEIYRPLREDRPSLEWGATVYLSNDDSMSLTSAQRTLYALMNGRPLNVSEIRPHELLNYFSFDHVTPDPEQVFDVLASAARDGDRLSVALAVKGASPPRQDLDLTVLVDRSCSMEAEGRMDYTRRGLTLMSNQLRRGDRVDVVLFDDEVCVPLENYVVGRDDPNLLRQTIAHMAPRGSTDVGLGLRKAYSVAKSHYDTAGRNRRVVVLTDALMNTGDVDPNTVSEIGRA